MWLLYALLAAVFAALVAIFGKAGIQKIDTTLATAIRAGVMFVFLALAAITLKKLPELPGVSSKTFFWIALSGLAGALSWFFYFLALKFAPASRVAPIDRLSVVFVIIFAALFLGEKLTLTVTLGAALVTLGAILIVL